MTPEEKKAKQKERDQLRRGRQRPDKGVINGETYYQRNRERILEYQRQVRLERGTPVRERLSLEERKERFCVTTSARKYGISKNAVRELRKVPRCQACDVLLSAERRSTRRCIDHCHKLGTVRGVLCHSCNVALGLLKDDPKSIEGLLRYLEKTTTIFLP